MDLPALGITLDLPPYAKLSGGWRGLTGAETISGTTLLVAGKDGSGIWRRIEFRGIEPRTLSDLYVDTSGFTKAEVVYVDSTAISAVVTETAVEYAGFGSSPSGAWQQDGKLMDLLSADGTAIRHTYDATGVEDSRKRGAWKVTDTNLLTILIDEDFDPVTRTWSTRQNQVDRNWRFNLIEGILYRGGMTRIGSSTNFFDSFTDAVYDDASSTWMKRVITIDNTGAVSFAIFASTDVTYEFYGDFTGNVGTWTIDPIATYTATTTGLPTAPEVGVLYDFSLVNVDIPDIVDGTYQILMYDDNHIAVMPEGMSR